MNKLKSCGLLKPSKRKARTFQVVIHRPDDWDAIKFLAERSGMSASSCVVSAVLDAAIAAGFKPAQEASVNVH